MLRIRRKLVLAGAAGSLLMIAAAILSLAQKPAHLSAMDRALRAQSVLPVDALQALQDLRLVAAVEIAYFNSHRRYAAPADLKAAGYLDPLWPRSKPEAYRISCNLAGDRPGFDCYADPVPPFTICFRIDATQIVRQSQGRRPDWDSPVFD